MQNSQDLQLLLNHPRRKWFVFAACAGLALLWGLPATEKYNELSTRQVELQQSTEQGQLAVQSLVKLRSDRDQHKSQITSLRARAMTQQNVQELRDRVVELARDAGCTMRRVKIADTATKRDWYEVDTPLDNRVRSDKDKKSPFKLQSQQLTIQITGPLENVLQMLEKLSSLDKFLETANLTLRRSTEDQNLVELDMEMLLFDLVKVGPEI